MPGEEIHRSPCWFALAVKPRFERAVGRTLELKGYETLLPLYRRRQPKPARSADADTPLFPGYVCCRFDVSKRAAILTTPGVIQIVGADNVPIPVAEIEVVSLQAAIRAGFTLQPFPYVHRGHRVRIERGVLAGVEGIVMSFKQTLRLVLSIALLERSVLLEVASDQVEVSECAGAAPRPMAGGEWQ